MKIQVGDVALHTLSGLYYRCENKKHERWMNMNPFYIKSKITPPESYFRKHTL